MMITQKVQQHSALTIHRWNSICMNANQFIQNKIYFLSYTLHDVIGDLFCSCFTMDGTYANQIFSNLHVRMNAMHNKQELCQILTTILSVGRVIF
jgi:nitrogenase subunit NifH